jgi:hypothetical protein
MRTRTGERGTALLMALVVMVLLAAIAAALISVSTTETLIAAAHRQGQEATYAADAALERALRDLSLIADWSAVLTPPPGNLTAGFSDGAMYPSAPGGAVLDLAELTANRQRISDARTGPAVCGANSPQWRLFAHADLRSLLPAGQITLSAYLLVWVADDVADRDGDSTRDANGRIQVYAEAHATSATRRAVEAAVTRQGDGSLALLAWREVR